MNMVPDTASAGRGSVATVMFCFVLVFVISFLVLDTVNKT